MKKCYLDTNVLVYFKNHTSSKNFIANKVINFLIQNNYQLLISPLVLDEFTHIIRLDLINNSKCFYLIKKTLQEIFALPNLAIINPSNSKKDQLKDQLKIVEYMKKYSLRPRDAYHLLTMQTHNIKHFATFDNDFKNVFNSKLLCPIKP